MFVGFGKITVSNMHEFVAIDPNNRMCSYILHFSEDQLNNEIYENLYLTNIKETSITVVTFEMLFTRT